MSLHPYLERAYAGRLPTVIALSPSSPLRRVTPTQAEIDAWIRDATEPPPRHFAFVRRQQ